MKELELLPKLMRPLVDVGVLPGDSERLKTWKRTTSFTLILAIPTIMVPYALLGWYFNSQYYFWFSVIWCFLHCCYLMWFRLRPHQFQVSIRFALWGTILASAVGAFFTGGPLSSGVLQIWGAYMLIFAFMYYPRKEAWWIFFGYSIVITLELVAYPWAPPADQIPEFWQQAMAMNNLVSFGFMSSLNLYLAQVEREATLNQLAEEKRKVELGTQELAASEAKVRELLHNMLPGEIASELSEHGVVRPARHESVSILFTDLSGFTNAAAAMPPDRMVAELNQIFAAFDKITEEEGVEKIKTIGDAYMAAAGVPTPCADHAQRAVRVGLRMVDFLAQRNQRSAFKWRLRVGIHSGPVVAGVIGTRKFAFDIWGDTVNIASRMESCGKVGCVNVSAYTYDLLQDAFECEYRGKVDAKGKGEIDMYFVMQPKPLAV